MATTKQFFPLVRQGFDKRGAYIKVGRVSDEQPPPQKFRRLTDAAKRIQLLCNVSAEVAIAVANQHFSCQEKCMTTHFLDMAKFEEDRARLEASRV